MRIVFWLSAALALAWTAASSSASAATRSRTFDVNGLVRTFVVSTPEGPPQPRPVVFALHGALGTPEQLRRYTNWDRVANQEGVVVVYPAGMGRTWNDDRPAAYRLAAKSSSADDVAFLTRLADSLVAEGTADPRAIYLTGVSNGGFMTMRLACEAPERFAGFAVIIGSMWLGRAETCRAPGPKPVMIMSGTNDRLVPYGAAAAAQRQVFGAAELAAYWARRNRCDDASIEAMPKRTGGNTTSVVIRVWKNCADRARVALVTIDGGGHQAPISPPPARAMPMVDFFLGARNMDIDMAETVWRFFKGARAGSID